MKRTTMKTDLNAFQTEQDEKLEALEVRLTERMGEHFEGLDSGVAKVEEELGRAIDFEKENGKKFAEMNVVLRARLDRSSQFLKAVALVLIAQAAVMVWLVLTLAGLRW